MCSCLVFVLDILCNLYSFKVMNVHAKFQHVDVFCKGCKHLVTSVLLGSDWRTIGSHAIHLKPTLWKTAKSPVKKQNTFIVAYKRLKHKTNQNLSNLRLKFFHREFAKSLWNSVLVVRFFWVSITILSRWKEFEMPFYLLPRVWEPDINSTNSNKYYLQLQ